MSRRDHPPELTSDDGRDPSDHAQDSAPAEVTMRGDLDKINLADIFQTLAMSKMEGLLYLSTTLERREVYFRDGLVRCVLPPRVESMRLGQRLVRAGLVTVDDLRHALLEQKQTRQPLGELLIARGAVAESHIDDVVSNQLQEDLFSLFTWRQGTFEFYRGEVADPVLRERVEAAPEFEVNGILLEVARRSDEWERVFETVGSLDEVVVLTNENDLEDETLDADDSRVLSAANGRRSVRDIADTTLIELFECCVRVRELLECDRLAFAHSEDVLEFAEELIRNSEPKRAAAILDALLTRTPPMEIGLRIDAAELLNHCGRSRIASQILIDASQESGDPEQATALAREARNSDPRSIDALRHLVDTLDRYGDRTELVDMRFELADALFNSGELNEALDELGGIEEDHGRRDQTRPRMARILQKQEQPDEAIEALLELTEELSPEKDKQKILGLYDQILRIDYRRKDIQKLRQKLQKGQTSQRIRLGIAAAVVLGVGAAGFVMLSSGGAGGSNPGLIDEVVTLAGQNKVDEATAVLRIAERSLDPDSPELARARGALAQATKRQRTQMRAQAEARADKIREKADAAFARGELQSALDLFHSQSAEGVDVARIDAQITRTVSEFTERAETVVDELRDQVPPAPHAQQDDDEQLAILAALEESFRPPEAVTVATLASIADDERLASALGNDYESKAAKWRRMALFFEEIERLTADYRSSAQSLKLTEQLTPLYRRAIEHEESYEFAAAREAFDELARRHPEDDDLKAEFRATVARLDGILARLRTIEEATVAGSQTTASARLDELQALHPHIPFEEFVELPLTIRSTPIGASVFSGQNELGVTPLVIRYRRGQPFSVRLELERFEGRSIRIDEVRSSSVEMTLARAPDWTFETNGTIDRPMIVLGDRVLFSDRSGSVTVLRTNDGSRVWSRQFDDISGLLTTPLLTTDRRVIVGSVDGKLRCLSLESGDSIWEVGKLPTESAVVQVGSLLVLATVDAEIIGIDRSNGQVSWRENLPSSVRADLLVIDSNVLAVTEDGEAIAFVARNGREAWRSTVGRGVVARPILHGSDAAIAAEDGTVALVDIGDGTVRWRSVQHGNLTVAPDFSRSKLYLPDDRTLQILSTDDGRLDQQIQCDSGFPGAVHVSNGHVFAPLGDGRVLVMTEEPLETIFELRGDRPAIAPATVLGDGTVLVAYGDRRLRAYRDLLRR
ncbi:MAG: DUF4388 domain-containing protein [Planctomycetota bacterium]